MSQRNYNNVTSLGTLSGPVAASATSLPTTAFSGYPAVPFTITVDRNTATEEICLVTGISGANLTVTRGFDGTAGQAHSAGATIEHTTGAIEFAEANAHVNATAGVHGVTGSLVGAQGAQNIYDKTLISPVAQADVTAGDAVVAYVPTAASVRNLFRGISPAGTDVTVITSDGALSTAGITSTAALHAQGNTQLDGTLTVTGVTALNGAVTVPAETASGNPVRKSTTDALNTRITANETTLTAATNAATASTLAKRDAAGRLQVADPSASADVATKNYVDNAAVPMRWTTVYEGPDSYFVVPAGSVADLTSMTGSVVVPTGAQLQVEAYVPRIDANANGAVFLRLLIGGVVKRTAVAGAGASATSFPSSYLLASVTGTGASVAFSLAAYTGGTGGSVRGPADGTGPGPSLRYRIV